MSLDTRKQISDQERLQINKQVQSDLIDHLYKECVPGALAGIPSGIAALLNFYGYNSIWLLAAWYLYYNFALLSLTSLYLFYKKYQYQHNSRTWLVAYSIAMSMCAAAWGLCVFLIPNELTREFISFLIVLLVASGYAIGSIGVFQLCLLTLSIIIIPFLIWCYLKGTFVFNLVAFCSLIYVSFMLGINKRSTQWFRESLKLKLENTLVTYQANHDILTGLPNQRSLANYIDHAIAHVRKTNEMFVLVSFSLNRMELVNDSLGYHAGDIIIQSVANRFNNLAEQMLRLNDQTKLTVLISRKDTFNILLVPVHPKDIYNRVKKLFSLLDEPFFCESKEIKMTASIGISVYPTDGDGTATLLACADAAMLQAKQFGGNRLEFYRSEINAEAPKRFELENALYNALKNNELILYYQPLIDLKTGEISGAEALLRWQHPVHGFISPMHFIPVAEETGLILPIDEWVLQKACSQLSAWHKMGFNTLKIAVNLAPKQLKDSHIIDVVQNTLVKTHLEASFLELELTESAILDESVIPLIKSFNNIGLSISVDDFGTGYSGLSYLKRFSIQKLKIDQSFIRDIPSNTDSITIVSAIIAMAKELKVKTLAEGVETKEQLLFLIQKKCDYMQGYYVSKPLDTNFFTQLLLSHYKLTEVTKVE